jgi:hypothetical protein
MELPDLSEIFDSYISGPVHAASTATVKVVWDDENNKEAMRPTELYVDCKDKNGDYANGGAGENIEINSLYGLL